MIKAELPVWRTLRNPRVHDPALAAVLALTSLHALWSPSPLVIIDFREPDLLGVVLSVVPAAAVAFRSRWPVAMLLVSIATSLLHAQLGYSQGIGSLAPLFPLYSVAVSRSFQLSGGLMLMMSTSLGVVLATGPFDPATSDWVSNLGIVVGAWAFGRSVRIRRLNQAHIEQRNQARLEAREAETRSLLVEERARTAQEMQDLVAHNLTEVSVQIAAARTVMRRDPEAAEALLLEAERIGRVALEEMRRAGGLLTTPGTSAPLRPQPDLDDLVQLVEQARRAGGDVRWTSTGDPAPVPPGVALTAYRLVEEALDNARQEGGRAPVEIAVAWDEGRLTVDVTIGADDTQVPWDRPVVPAGVLNRLRTRVSAYGGELKLSQRRDGRSRVSAWFPLAGVGGTA